MMNFINLFLVCVSAILIRNAAGEPPNFRILAPPFVCPKDKDAVIDKPDKTVVTLQTDASLDVQYHWTVRWHPLVTPTQRSTLEIWRSVRELEFNLNDDLQIEPNVFIINNDELLSGVKYIFNVTATTSKDEEGTEKVFEIDNIKGDPKLLMEGRSDMFSIDLIGAQIIYSDMDYVLEAQVTTCYRTNDYYFVWTVTSGGDNVAVWDTKGSRLEIRANTLTPGQSYDVLCQVYRFSNGEFITQNSLPFRVLHRGYSINFNVDLMQVSVGTPFVLHTDFNRLDYLNSGLTITWLCTIVDGTMDSLYNSDVDGTLSFPYGLSTKGEYHITLTVTIADQSVEGIQAKTRVIAVDPGLPVLEVVQRNRVVNEGSIVTLVANVTKMAPGCSIGWYFNSEVCLKSEFSTATEDCHETQHGNPISTPINFYSLEENFLSELTDYTNETGFKLVTANMKGATGKARVAAECSCVDVNNCANGVVFADIMFEANDKPLTLTKYMVVMPIKGTAMETLFRVSTLAVADPTRPLRYSFYCRLGSNDTLLLGTYLEHLAVETFLPYIEGGVNVWAEVCDSLGACAEMTSITVPVSPGEARTVDALLEDVHAHVRRCELMFLRRLAASAVVTYTNANQTEALNKFTTTLLNELGGIEAMCIEKNYDKYHEFLYWLQGAGIDTTKL